VRSVQDPDEPVLDGDLAIKLGSEETKYRNALGRLGYIEIPGSGISGPIAELFVWPRLRDYERTRRADFEDEDPRVFSRDPVSTFNLATFPSNRLRRCIIVAGPGFGKSALLGAIRNRLLEVDLVPVIIPVALLAASHVDVLSYLTDHTNKEFNVSIDWAKLCERGQAVVLFDGLDEVPLASRHSVLESIQRFDARYERAAWALTIRDPAVLAGPTEARIFEIQPLDDTDVVTFANAWKKRLPHIDGWELTRRLDAYPDLKLLVRIPLFLCLLLATWQSESPLPKNRRELIEAYLHSLLKPERHKAAIPDNIDSAVFREAVERIAFNSLERQEIGPSEHHVLALIRAGGHSFSADAMFERFIRLGILKRTGSTRLEFPFPIIQEYLAGCYIVHHEAHTLQARTTDAIQRPWAQVIQFALELYSDASAIIQNMLSLRDDAFHTALRLVGRCVVNGARVNSELRAHIAIRLAEIWPYGSWELRERIGSLVADGFTTPLVPAVRRCLSHEWLLHSGVARIVCSLKDSEVTFEVVRAHLEKLSSTTYLRDLRPAIDPIANEVYAMYAARARQVDVTEEELDGLSNLVEDISPEQLKPGTYLDLALDETLPILLRLASYCSGPRPLDSRAWPLVEEGIRSDNWKVRSQAADALSRHARVKEKVIDFLKDESLSALQKRDLASDIKRLFPEARTRDEFIKECLSDHVLPEEVRDIMLIYAARYGDANAFRDLIERLTDLPIDFAAATISLFGHHRDRDLGIRAVDLLRKRVKSGYEAAGFANSAHTGMTSIYQMDFLRGGGLEPCLPHPAIEEFAVLLNEWAFAPELNFELDERISVLTAASQLTSDRTADVLCELVTSVCTRSDISIDAPEGIDHSLRHALDELRYKRVFLDLAPLEALVRKSKHNAASGAVDMIGALGSREAFDVLLTLYADVTDWYLRGHILGKLETLSGRLSLLVYEDDGRLVVTPSSTTFPLKT
jgi:hypothetical protein